MLLGAIVIVVVGVMVVNLFGKQDNGEAIPPIETEEDLSLPSSYKVKAGEDLWKISEKFYGTGYNWTDIASTNNITDPNQLTEGQELTIPDVEVKVLAQASPTPVVEETIQEQEEIAMEFTQEDEIPADNPIKGATYTVEKGDTLWDISVRAYGDGYRWVDIAAENELVNPDIIHRGNVFVLPR